MVKVRNLSKKRHLHKKKPVLRVSATMINAVAAIIAMGTIAITASVRATATIMRRATINTKTIKIVMIKTAETISSKNNSNLLHAPTTPNKVSKLRRAVNSRAITMSKIQQLNRKTTLAHRLVVLLASAHAAMIVNDNAQPQ